MAKARSKIPWLDTENNGVYHVYWYDPELRRTRRLTLGTKEAAEAQPRYAAFLLEHQRVGGEIKRLLEPQLTVAQALDDYWKEHAMVNLGERGQETQGYAKAKFTAAFGPLAVAELTPEMFTDQDTGYYAKRRAGWLGHNERPATNGTLTREVSVLIAAINHAVKRKRLSADKAPNIPSPPPTPPRDRWLTHEELDALFRAALGDRPNRLPRVYRFVTSAYYTASRKTAILELKRFQIDLRARKIQLNPPGRIQTRKKRALVPIFDEHLPILLRAEAEAINEWHLDSAMPVREAFDRARDAAGLGRDVTPHTLRHTRATHLLQAGTDPWAVAGLLGDTLATVMKVYGHHCPDHIRAAVERALKSGDTSGDTTETL